MHTAPAPTTAAGGYLTTDEVRKDFLGGVSTQTVLNYVAKRGLPSHRVGRRHLFDPAEVDAWLRDRDSQTPANDHRVIIKRLVDAAPELTAEQAERIRTVLTGGAQ